MYDLQYLFNEDLTQSRFYLFYFCVINQHQRHHITSLQIHLKVITRSSVRVLCRNISHIQSVQNKPSTLAKIFRLIRFIKPGHPSYFSKLTYIVVILSRAFYNIKIIGNQNFGLTFVFVWQYRGLFTHFTMEDSIEWKMLKMCSDRMDLIITSSVTYSKNDW